MVSALTVASSMACLDAYGDMVYRIQEENGATNLQTVMHIIFVLINTTGILAGLHSTLIFSLATMYGRTAGKCTVHEISRSSIISLNQTSSLL